MNIIVTLTILILVVFLIYTLKSSDNSYLNINNTTKCHPIKDNFDFWCKKMFGGDWGLYKKIDDASCESEQTKARCKKNWSGGHNIGKKSTGCLKNKEKAQKRCNKLYGNKSKLLDIDKADCPNKYFRGKCS